MADRNRHQSDPYEDPARGRIDDDLIRGIGDDDEEFDDTEEYDEEDDEDADEEGTL